MKNKLLMTALTFATVSAALVGCNGLNDNVATSNNNQTVKNTVTDNTNNNGTTTDSNNLITEDEAKKIALEHSGIQESDITNFRIKLDTDDGIKEYEVEFLSGNTEYDYDINAISGEIISFDNDVENDFNSNSNDTSNSNNTSGDASNVITEDEAKKIALEHAGLKESDITNFRIKLDTDDGMKEYEIEFYSGNTEYDYDINAISGEVISFDNDIENDFNNNSNNTADNSNELITEDEAMAIALKDAGINEADATSLRIKLDTDDGVKEYEIEFYTADKEYDYEINASTGNIISKDVENLKNN
ncbi:PepSY domain-containing protein [Clostridium sp. Marseille-P299]|uniref:PepSY domain-containing protein n=1 Tax=Clostridium sp. Marseille-P299 TaxID=1805477 RepID=UPI0008314DA3|nr:PepSY domain-containing protein [Clostridium sp. Marseille-P299]